MVYAPGTLETDQKKQNMALQQQASAIKTNTADIAMLNTSYPSSKITGTTTNDNASAGYIGEYISSTVLSASAISLTTSTPANVTSISLTAGDWDVWATVDTNTGATTDVTQVLGWISTTSATVPTAPNGGAFMLLNYPATTHVGLNDHFAVGLMRVSVASTTTVYLSCRMIFTVSTAKMYGFIGARRVR